VLLEAAQRLEPLDAALARQVYLEAMFLASNAGRLGDGVATPARAARGAPRASEAGDTSDLLVDGLAIFFTDGYSAGVPILKQALAKARDERGRGENELRAIRIASRVAAELFDEQTWTALVDRHVEVSRQDGILLALPVTLGYLAAIRVYEGNLEGAEIALDESDSIVTSESNDPMRLLLTAYRGDEEQTTLFSTRLDTLATERGVGLVLTVCDYSRAVLHNSLGQYEAAAVAAQRAVAPNDLSISSLALPELVEAGARSGQTELANEAFERLAERTRAAGTTFARGVEACSRALLSDDTVAEDSYREALDALGATSMRMFHARAQLLYGEWLRRANRRTDARAQLEQAQEFFVRVGADGFAGRAARELLATGATPRKRTDEARGQLTAQEAQIAALARDGHTNSEIGAQLFLSPRTVEWHLRHVFTKLDISSRRQLRTALPA